MLDLKKLSSSIVAFSIVIIYLVSHTTLVNAITVENTLYINNGTAKVEHAFEMGNGEKVKADKLIYNNLDTGISIDSENKEFIYNKNIMILEAGIALSLVGSSIFILKKQS